MRIVLKYWTVVCFVSGRQPERFVLSSMVEIDVFEERFRNDIQKIVSSVCHP